ncbi:hypothetical protein [Pantoea agglomerans]|uniref:hypothetical protein n=1 Tax=Enterobacter agglomerans TaxID=549 RepID=UPI00301C366A
MANVVITPLSNTGFSGSFVNQLNSNLSKLAEAVNNGVLWRATPSTGQTSMSTDFNVNGFHIFNAKVDGADLVDVKRKAYASMSLIADAKAWVDVAEQYSEDAQGFVQQALGQAYVATQQAQKAALQAASAEQWANRAASTVGAISSVVTQVDFNASALSALTKTVTSNKTASDATASSLAQLSSTVSALNTTVTSNKASSDATARSLATLTTTVTSNKTSADASQAALTALTARVTTEEGKVNSVASGGTGATTVAAARTALGVGYTASTSSTQQIYYFDNGMMMIHSVVSPPAVAPNTTVAFSWTYPQTFAQVPFVSCTPVVNYSGVFKVGIEVQSTTIASGYLFNNHTETLSPVLHFFAYGVKP